MTRFNESPQLPKPCCLRAPHHRPNIHVNDGNNTINARTRKVSLIRRIKLRASDPTNRQRVEWQRRREPLTTRMRRRSSSPETTSKLSGTAHPPLGHYLHPVTSREHARRLTSRLPEPLPSRVNDAASSPRTPCNPIAIRPGRPPFFLPPRAGKHTNQTVPLHENSCSHSCSSRSSRKDHSLPQRDTHSRGAGKTAAAANTEVNRTSPGDYGATAAAA